MFKIFKNLFSSSGKSITNTELKDILSKENIILLDVRSTKEYQSGHIKNSQNIPLQNIHQYKRSKSEPVYIICKSGVRSRLAAKVLRKKGYETINIQGGMSAYNKEN